jgi:hypothetical protein
VLGALARLRREVVRARHDDELDAALLRAGLAELVPAELYEAAVDPRYRRNLLEHVERFVFEYTTVCQLACLHCRNGHLAPVAETNVEALQRAVDLKAEHVVATLALHHCPNDGQLSGEAGITPPLSVDCNEGPGGRCVPSEKAGGPGHYDAALWHDNPVWKALEFEQEYPHYFHYNFEWSNTAEGDGACEFTVQAFGDLDDDGVFSTFERSGTADSEGVNAAVGLYIDKELE